MMQLKEREQIFTLRLFVVTGHSEGSPASQFQVQQRIIILFCWKKHPSPIYASSVIQQRTHCLNQIIIFYYCYCIKHPNHAWKKEAINTANAQSGRERGFLLYLRCCNFNNIQRRFEFGKQ